MEEKGNAEPEWLSEMRRFYARVDAAVAEQGLHCEGCGECCHFDTVDHILYAGVLERKYLAAVAELPQKTDADASLLEQGKRCPYQSNTRCEARDARVLGCRLHFCEWANSDEEMDFAEKWHTELKTLHAALNEDWNYRPLLPIS